MNSRLIIDIVIKAIKDVDSPRFFKTERGYQGRFACALYKELDEKEIFPDDAIIEEEYQKNLKDHRTKQRPDLIIHVPAESSQSRSKAENNFVVFAFKKRASEHDAEKDFKKLNELFKNLKYPLGIFININGNSKVFMDKYIGSFRNRIHELCVTQTNEKLDIIHAYFQDDKVIAEKIDCK